MYKLLMFFISFQDESDVKECMGLSWIHSDIMDDNIQMKPSLVKACLDGNAGDNSLSFNGSKNGWNDIEESESWCPSYILDFSNLSIGSVFFFPVTLHGSLIYYGCETVSCLGSLQLFESVKNEIGHEYKTNKNPLLFFFR